MNIYAGMQKILKVDTFSHGIRLKGNWNVDCDHLAGQFHHLLDLPETNIKENKTEIFTSDC